MTTTQTFVEGKCGEKNIRIKIWNHGFSIKCVAFKQPKTLVGMPYHKELFLDDLKQFCVGCERNKP